MGSDTVPNVSDDLSLGMTPGHPDHALMTPL
jgi:hypothetical protein